jgi:hypothetical protein
MAKTRNAENPRVVPTGRSVHHDASSGGDKLGADPRGRRRAATTHPRGNSASSRSESHRIQFDFEEGAYQRLENLRKETESPTKAEVVRQALRIYEWLVKKAYEGKRLVLEDNETREGPIDLQLIIPVSRERHKE